jgi:hypothetical protein
MSNQLGPAIRQQISLPYLSLASYFPQPNLLAHKDSPQLPTFLKQAYGAQIPYTYISMTHSSPFS